MKCEIVSQETFKTLTMPTLSDILSIFLGHLKAQKLKAKLNLGKLNYVFNMYHILSHAEAFHLLWGRFYILGFSD